MPTLRHALQILGKDLRQRVRDRSLFLLGIGVPLGLSIVFGLVFGEILSGGFSVAIGIVDEADNGATRPLVDSLARAEADGLTGHVIADRTAAVAALDAGEVDAVLVLPPAAGIDPSAAPRVLAHVDRPTSAAVAAAVGEAFTTTVAAVAQAVAAADRLDDGTDPFALAAAVATSEGAVRLVDEAADDRQLDSQTYIAAGMAVMFLFFTVGFGVMGHLEERRDGTLQRLLAAPIPRASIVIGKAFTSLVLGVLTMVTLVVATTLILDASWGHVIGVGVLVGAAVVAATGIVGAITAVARHMEQAETLQAIVAIGLGMLGGAFFPLGDGTGLLGALSRVTPHHWFLEGLADLQGGAPASAALPAAGALLLFAMVVGGAGVAAARRQAP